MINVPMDFAWIGQGSIAGVPIPVIIMLIVVVVADILLRRGEHCANSTTWWKQKLLNCQASPSTGSCLPL